LTWIVTGGAGYIGAHVVRLMQAEGFEVVVFDDLSAGIPGRLPADVPLVRGSITVTRDLDRLFHRHRPAGVIHLAALKSVARPADKMDRFELHNVTGVQNLLAAMHRTGVANLVFSSSAAVYGDPDRLPVDEAAAIRPVSRYGESKRDAEKVIGDAAAGGRIRAITLRQFNVVGAGTHPCAADTGPTNLLPSAFRALTGGPPLPLFGNGTTFPSIRDYVHVEDVARAHLLSVRLLEQQVAEDHLVLNIGSGRGYTVGEVVQHTASIAGANVPGRAAYPRIGDVRAVIADVDLARKRLEWKAELTLADAVASAWDAWQSCPAG
jgi:UDP-glucose 4-epimerase